MKRYRFYLGNDLDRVIVQAMIDDATAELVALSQSMPLYQMNELERSKLVAYAAEGTDEYELLARLEIQISSDLEQIYLDGITP